MDLLKMKKIFTNKERIKRVKNFECSKRIASVEYHVTDCLVKNGNTKKEQVLFLIMKNVSLVRVMEFTKQPHLINFQL